MRIDLAFTLRPRSHVSGWLLSHAIRRKSHRIGIAFTRIWIDFLSCSHVARYDSYPDKLYADRPCIHTHPSPYYSDRLFTRVWARRIVHRKQNRNFRPKGDGRSGRRPLLPKRKLNISLGAPQHFWVMRFWGHLFTWKREFNVFCVWCRDWKFGRDTLQSLFLYVKPWISYFSDMNSWNKLEAWCVFGPLLCKYVG